MYVVALLRGHRREACGFAPQHPPGKEHFFNILSLELTKSFENKLWMHALYAHLCVHLSIDLCLSRLLACVLFSIQ